MSATFLVDVPNAGVLGTVMCQAITQATTGTTGVDMLNVDGPVTMLAAAGAIAGTISVLNVSLYESSSPTTGWGLIGTGNTNITGLTVGNSAAAIVNFYRTKRYVNAVVAYTGQTSAMLQVSFLGRKKIRGTDAGYSSAPTS